MKGRIILMILLSFVFLIPLSYSKDINALQFRNELLKGSSVGINVNWLVFKKLSRVVRRDVKKGVNLCSIFKKRGFSHIRLRVKSNVDLNLLKKIIYQCKRAKMPLIIAYGAEELKENPTTDNVINAVDFWRKVIPITKGFDNLAFDLMIEPGKRITRCKSVLERYYIESYRLIRRYQPYRIVMFAPNRLANPLCVDGLRFLKKLHDRYVMIQWHMLAAGPKKGVKRQKCDGRIFKFNTPFDEVKIKLAYISRWSEINGIPTWCGAIMLTNYNKVNRGKKAWDGAPNGGCWSVKWQIRFAKFLRKEFKKYRIPFAINAGDKYYDYTLNRWYKSKSKILEALLK